MTEQELVKTHNLKIGIRKKCLANGITTAYQLQARSNLVPAVAQNIFRENFSEI